MEVDEEGRQRLPQQGILELSLVIDKAQEAAENADYLVESVRKQQHVMEQGRDNELRQQVPEMQVPEMLRVSTGPSRRSECPPPGCPPIPQLDAHTEQCTLFHTLSSALYSDSAVLLRSQRDVCSWCRRRRNIHKTIIAVVSPCYPIRHKAWQQEGSFAAKYVLACRSHSSPGMYGAHAHLQTRLARVN